LSDLGSLVEHNATRQDIANAFGVPISYLTAESNLANLQASERQHMSLAIAPRLSRRDEKLNEQLLPLFDPTGRLFLTSDDPVPLDQDAILAQVQQDLQYGVLTINEIREGRSLPPVPWGNVPWMPTRWAPTDVPRATGTNPILSPADAGDGPDNTP